MTGGLGASTFAFVWREPGLEALRRLRALGLNDLDIVLAPGHCWPADLSTADRARLVATLAAEDIRIDSVNFPALDLNLASCVPEVRAYSVGRYREALLLGAELGARGVVTVPGRVSPLIGPLPADTERWLGESLGELLATAREADVSVFLELHPQTPIPTVDSLDRFVAGFDDPRLRVAYDVANAEFVSEDHAEALRRLAPRLGQVHLSDASATHWAHDRIGSGTVDFATVFRTLEGIAFGGACILEVVTATPLPDLEASLDALASALRAKLPLVDTGRTG